MQQYLEQSLLGRDSVLRIHNGSRGENWQPLQFFVRSPLLNLVILARPGS